MTLFVSCNKRNVIEWTDQEIDTWFVDSQWSNDLQIKPDVSIDRRLFVEQNVLNPESWEIAYKFLKESDFNSLSLGRYKLFEDGTYATIDEYVTKDSSRFEAHLQFVDIQFLVKGKEYIHITTLNNRTQITPYNKEKDIGFFDKDEFTENILSTENFMVFFPSDGHKPCIKVEDSEMVRKVVIKIPYVGKTN